MNPLQIVAFLDGRPAHEKQTKGILQAMAGLTPTNIRYRSVPKPSFSRGVLDWLAFVAAYGLNLKTAGKDYYSAEPLDLIIGTGSRTHIPMLILKKQCGARLVTCMTPNSFLIKKIDLCFVPQHDNQQPSENVFFTVGPPNTSPFLEKKDKGKGLILVGGIDEKSHTWRSQDTIAQIRSILKRDPSIIWTIATSPRTPNDMNSPLNDLASANPNVTFFRPEDTERGWIEDQYAENYFVWVTADSISMIYEALTSGCRVGVLPVQFKRKNSKYVKSVEYVLNGGMAISYEQWKMGELDIVSHDRLDEANRCANEILRRWWPDRLQ